MFVICEVNENRCKEARASVGVIGNIKWQYQWRLYRDTLCRSESKERHIRILVSQHAVRMWAM